MNHNSSQEIRDNVVNLLAKEPYLSKDCNLFLIKYWATYDGVKGIKEIMTKGTPADQLIDAHVWATSPYGGSGRSRQQFLDF